MHAMAMNIGLAGLLLFGSLVASACGSGGELRSVDTNSAPAATLESDPMAFAKSELRKLAESNFLVRVHATQLHFGVRGQREFYMLLETAGNGLRARKIEPKPTVAQQVRWAEVQEIPLRLKFGEQRISAATCPRLRQIYTELGQAMRSTLQELGRANLPPTAGSVRVDEVGVVWTLENGAWFSEPVPLCEPAWHYDIQWRERPELVISGDDLFSEHAGWIKQLIELFDTCDHDYAVVKRP